MVEEFAGRWFALGRTLGTTEIDQLTTLCARALYAGAATGAYAGAATGAQGQDS
jgi:hypothetical protein